MNVWLPERNVSRGRWEATSLSPGRGRGFLEALSGIRGVTFESGTPAPATDRPFRKRFQTDPGEP